MRPARTARSSALSSTSPRETRVVALGKPSDRDRTGWYFQRFLFPSCRWLRELVLFNRSWYNRAGVERVMGFCTEAEHEEFMGSVSNFENMLVRSGVKLLKYYLDISKAEQKRRLKDRKTDPLKQWKVSPIDDQALKHWKQYSLARNEMLARTQNRRRGLWCAPTTSVWRGSISSRICSAGFTTPARISG